MMHVTAVFLNVDRLSILELSADNTEYFLTHSTEDSSRVPTNFRVDDLAWYSRRLLNKEEVLIADVDQLPEQANNLKSTLRSRGIRSSLSVPLEVSESVLGALEFSSTHRAMEWPEPVVAQCRIAGRIFAGALSRKRADQALTSSERIKDSIVASLAIHVAVLNQEGIVIAVRNRLSEPGSGKLAAPHSVAPGDDYLEVVQCALGRGTRQAETAIRGIRAVCAGEQDRIEIEYPYQCEDKQHWFLMTVTGLSNSSERALVVHRNISKERWAKQAIRELSGKLIRAQEEERSRIARELHDDISQQLVLLEIDLRRIQSGGSPQVDLEGACKTIDDISHDVHRLSHRLHSTKLEHLGLLSVA
jgi:hypothetical protein